MFDKKKCCSGKFHWFVTGLKTVPGTDTKEGGGGLDTYSPKCQCPRPLKISGVVPAMILNPAYG